MLRVLLSHSDLTIKQYLYCNFALSDTNDGTLGDYIAGHLAEFTAEDKNSIQSSCKKVDGANGQCSVFFNVGAMGSFDQIVLKALVKQIK